ncbi:MAG TPA: lysylphosphatidylglycerol synthase transmembrane domain-containing protein [Gemmatimonadales bacterium]|nr:lysylphosphatidylglycerol synthase transmembrane domain-containing protein [Gemmatimonadales bacterium]
MKLWHRVALSAGLLAVLLVVLPWHELRTAFASLSAPLWLGVLGGFVLGHAIGVFKWRFAVNAGRGGLGTLDGAKCYAAGLFANLCLPSIVGGDVLRVALAAKATRRPEAAVWGGVADRLSDVVALSLLVAAGALTARTALPGLWAQLLGLAGVIGVLAAVIALPLALRRPLAKWPKKIRRHVARSMVAIRRISRRPGTAVTILALSLTIQGGFVLLNAALGAGVGIRVPLAVWFLVWPLAKVVSLLPISLGGLAVREATLAALLVPFGVRPSVGVAASLVWQSVLIAGGLLGGLLWLVLRRSGSEGGVSESVWRSAKVSSHG